jgi:hypothetical protein
LSTGWIHTRPDSPYEKIWFVASIKTFFYNFVVISHRFLDYGRVFVFIFILISIIKFRKRLFTKQIKQLVLLAISASFVVIVTSLLAVNELGHRYFIASYLAIILIAFIIIKEFSLHKKVIYSILLIGLLTGNLWIYPKTIAQGWDASLAHVPYHNLRHQAIDYLNKNDISIEKIASFFPNKTLNDNIDLNGDKASFEEFTGENKYVFYSNVYNLKDEQYQILDTKYTIIKKFSKNRIHIYLYKLKEK